MIDCKCRRSKCRCPSSNCRNLNCSRNDPRAEVLSRKLHTFSTKFSDVFLVPLKGVLHVLNDLITRPEERIGLGRRNFTDTLRQHFTDFIKSALLAHFYESGWRNVAKPLHIRFPNALQASHHM